MSDVKAEVAAGVGDPPRTQAHSTPPDTPSRGGMMDREMQRDRELQREIQAPPAGYGTRAAAGYDTAPRAVAAAAPAEGTPLVQSPAGAAGAAGAAKHRADEGDVVWGA